MSMNVEKANDMSAVKANMLRKKKRNRMSDIPVEDMRMLSWRLYMFMDLDLEGDGDDDDEGDVLLPPGRRWWCPRGPAPSLVWDNVPAEL
mmetsp:Transcript_20931/g.31442  ORF Transcript_20931/g.31442 Transcript_20931/m.31442 type:complete len:90 (-) Transcript_20931:744-1013(-)